MKKLALIFATGLLTLLILSCDNPAGSSGGDADADAANNFKSTYAVILSRTVDTVAVTDESAVNYAAAAFNSLSDGAKALLTAEKTRLDDLQSQIVLLKVAASFRSDHAAILGKTIDTYINATDQGDLDAALSAYDILSDAKVKALLAPEKALLDALKVASNATVADLAAANSFKTNHAAILAETIETVTSNDETAVNTALSAFEDLSETVKLLLGPEKQLLDNLKAKIDGIKNIELKLHYKFEITEGKIRDEVGSNHATIAASTDGFVSKLGSYNYYYTGTNGWLDMGASVGSIIAGLNQGFTLESWIWIDSDATHTGAGNMLAAFAESDNIGNTGKGMYIKLKSNENQGFAITPQGWGNEQTATVNGAVIKGEWQHIVYTQTGTTGIFYVNGVEKVRSEAISLLPKDLGSTAFNAIAKPPFSGDVALSKTRIATFKIYNAALPPAEIAEAAAVVLPSTHTVTFDTQGGSAVPTESKAFGATLGTLPTSTKSGYLITGWNTQADGQGSVLTPETKINGDITIYAVWTSMEDIATITFDTNSLPDSVAAPAPITIAKNGTATSLPTLGAREWYNFIGWFTAASDGEEFTTGTTVSSNITVYAHWQKIPFKVIASSTPANMANLADGNTSTTWSGERLHHFGHVDLQHYDDSGVYKDTDTTGMKGFRHWITIDLGEVVADIKELRYQPRWNTSAGQAVKSGEVYASSEVPLRINIQPAIDEGKVQKVATITDWPGTNVASERWDVAAFDTAVSARYIQLRVFTTSTQPAANVNFNVAVGELKLFKSEGTEIPLTGKSVMACCINKDQQAMIANRAIDGTINNASNAWLSGPIMISETPNFALLKSSLPKDYRLDVGHWVTLDLGEVATDVTGFSYTRYNSNGPISDLEIWASSNTINPANTATQNNGMFLVKSATCLGIATSGTTTVDFGVAQTARYLHIRIYSHQVKSNGDYLAMYGYADAAEFAVVRSSN
jgi:uncharacterized repeat protein (TIGR02543 family)